MATQEDVKKTLDALGERTYVVKDWQNSNKTQWYRKWSNGLIECGVTITNKATGDWSGEVALPIAFSNTSYDVIVQPFKLNKNAAYRSTSSDVYGKTTTSVYCGWYWGAGSQVDSIFVYVRGY